MGEDNRGTGLVKKATKNVTNIIPVKINFLNMEIFLAKRNIKTIAGTKLVPDRAEKDKTDKIKIIKPVTNGNLLYPAKTAR